MYAYETGATERMYICLSNGRNETYADGTGEMERMYMDGKDGTERINKVLGGERMHMERTERNI